MSVLNCQRCQTSFSLLSDLLDIHELFNENLRTWAGGEEASRAGKQAAGGAHD